jgi:YaiO family outer membrane protein
MSFPESSVKNRFPSQLRFSAFLLLLLWVPCLSQAPASRDSLKRMLSQAREYSLQKNYGDALQLYSRYLQQIPIDNDVRNEFAKVLSWKSEFDSSLAQYDVVIRRNPNNFDAHFGRCQVLAWKHDYQNAARELELLSNLSPGNIDVYLLGGRINSWSRDYNQSLVLYQKALALDGLNEEALAGKCRALQGMGKKDEAFAAIVEARKRFPRNAEIEQLYLQLTPAPQNQIYAKFQNEAFDVQGRSDHRTISVQYYRSVLSGLTAYAEFDAYHRFDQNDQSVGLGAYYTINSKQSLFGYALVSLDPKVTSALDLLVEYSHRLQARVSGTLAYRLIDFKSETVHIIAPGFSWNAFEGLSVNPKMYVSRTVITKTTSYAFAVQMLYEQIGRLTPFVYYAVGNEAYRGVTLDNVESSDSWSLTVGARYVITNWLAVRANYQYLNRIGNFRENSLDVGLGYYW